MKFDFSDRELTEEYPDYLHSAIAQWLSTIFQREGLGYNRHTTLNNSITNITPEYINRLNTIFRIEFPSDIDALLGVIFSEADLTSNFLAIILQNYAKDPDVRHLEVILADGGSAFAVTKTDKTAGEYEAGVYDLTKRVPKTWLWMALLSRQLLSSAKQRCRCQSN